MVAPGGTSSTPSIDTADRSVARTVSSTLLVSDPSGVVSVADSVAPAWIVSSRNSGSGGGGGGGGGASLNSVGVNDAAAGISGFDDLSSTECRAVFALAPAVGRGLVAASDVGATAGGGVASATAAGAACGANGALAGASAGLASVLGFVSAPGPAAFNDVTCDFRISLIPPSRRWTTSRSCFTSTSRPDTLLPSFLTTVTSVPSG